MRPMCEASENGIIGAPEIPLSSGYVCIFHWQLASELFTGNDRFDDRTSISSVG